MKKYTITGAVLAGSLLLVAPLSALLMLEGFETLRGLLGIGPIDGPASLLGGFVVLWVALYTAVEVTRVRLHGFSELRRGTPGRRILRHGILGTITALAVLSLVEFLVSGLVGAIDAGQSAVAAGLVATLMVLGWAVVRSLLAFRQGIAGAVRPRRA